MKFFIILSSVLLVGVWAQQVPDATAQATQTLAPVIGQVDEKSQVTNALLNNVQSAVNPGAAAGLTTLVSGGLTSGLTSQFDALSVITNSVADVPDALICAVNASTAILGSIASGASNTVNCLLNKVLAVPSLLSQVTNVLQQLALNSLTNTLSLITSCVTKSLLTLDIAGALACAGNIINSVLLAVTGLLTTIVAVLGQAINLVLSLVSCAVTALATVVGIAGNVLNSAVSCVYKIALINVILPPLDTIIPDFSSVIQAGINLILQLDPLIQQIQTLIASITNNINAILNKKINLTAEGIQTFMQNAVSSTLNLIKNALTLNLVGPALVCVNTAQQNVNALIQNGVQTVLSCAGSIANVAQAALGEVTGYGVQVVTTSVSAGIPLIVQCATSAFSFSLSAVQSCVDNVVNQATQLITVTLNRLQALVVQVQNLVAAIDQCQDDATAVVIQAVQGIDNTLRSCLGGLGITI